MSNIVVDVDVLGGTTAQSALFLIGQYRAAYRISQFSVYLHIFV